MPTAAIGREMPVITALKSMTAIGKFLCQQPTKTDCAGEIIILNTRPSFK
jgi:hypothetical protein